MRKSRTLLATLSLALSLFTAPAAVRAQEVNTGGVLTTYADIAQAGFEDALSRAKELETAVDALIAAPSEDTLGAARQAWIASRPAYQQTEAYRFGNPLVDAWEGRVNAWPLDEGLIDYVDASYGTESDTNSLYTANVVANSTLMVDGVRVDASNITPDFLQNDLQEAGGIESNVATGYHAIEFLLWGQDLNGTGPGAGNRPATDYSTAPHADRRAAYLKAATSLLVRDLAEMVGEWQADGAARAALPDLGISAILTGMGSLSFGELAGQRMKLGLMLHDPEEEHDCFSDTTATSYLYDGVGVRNVYLGNYIRIDGSAVTGASISDLVAAKDPALDAEIRALLDDSVNKLQVLVDRAAGGESYDQQIGEGNIAGNAAVQAAIDALMAQTRGVERAVALLNLAGVSIEDSDSLSNPEAVFQ
ncbi:imelysin family protein [Devosia algicola]|uniref:Imelysin family protein n=1 Tax=Devosia algicola TaxID=3026418 RepID=A0ABY7YS32_9HYPH|nr:imelysin family protein [Devosia algicola]WDR04139.1 imelysin family protein [Devosia algicola]